jgi:hypothetical protein
MVRVDPANLPPTPVTRINVRIGPAASSVEYDEASPRYADIYSNQAQFSFLLDKCNTSSAAAIVYSADAIAGNDPITNVTFTTY